MKKQSFPECAALPTLPESPQALNPADPSELDDLLDHVCEADLENAPPEQIEAALVGEWSFVGRGVRDGEWGWRSDYPARVRPFCWRFYPEGLLWERGAEPGGAWFPYSVYQARRELIIVRNPQVGRDWQEERYLLKILTRRFLWLHELHGQNEQVQDGQDGPNGQDGQGAPQHSLIFWRCEPSEPSEDPDEEKNEAP